MTVYVHESTVIAAPARVVWDLLRDFNAHNRWHPAIAASHIEDGLSSQKIGAVRNFRLQDGGTLREQMISCSDRDMSLRYCLLSAPVPLMDYVATMRLRPVTDGDQCLLQWSSEFSPPDTEREAMIALVRDGIYRAGFTALKNWFSGAAQPAPRLKPNPAPTSQPAPNRPAKSIVMTHHGGPEVLVMQDIQIPEPGPGEVRLKQSFIGLNFIDIHCRTGAFDLVSLPGTPGMEAVGQVAELGPGVHDFRVGGRVGYACAPTGAYCTERVMSADMLVQLPDELPDEIAAAVLLKGMTASFLVHDVHAIAPGEVVLIHAASGGVGQLLVQWARAIGATVVATASSSEKLEVARRNGADYVINYRHEDFVSAIREITDGKGADVIYDGVGQSTIARSFEAAAVRGHVVSFGEASGPLGQWDIGQLSTKSLRFSRPNFGHYVGSQAQVVHHSNLVFNAIESGVLCVSSPTVFSLENAAEAHKALEDRTLPWAAVLSTNL